MKKTLSIVFVLAIMAVVSVNSFASDMMMPRWSNIFVMVNEITFDGTSGNASGSVVGQAGTSYITGTLTVYEENGSGGWTYVDSVSGENESGKEFMALSVEFTGESGKNYKSILSVTVYDSVGKGESEEKPATKKCP